MEPVNDERNNMSDSKSLFKEWLEKLQQESWQLELLISGFALYGIYEGKSVLNVIYNYYDLNTYGPFAGFIWIFWFALTCGWFIFFINLLIHVILRGMWIGAIGLRYVSGEIDYEKLNYSEYFTKYLKNKVGTYDDFIERLEKICSVLFAYTFLLFLLFMSLILFGAFLGFILISIAKIFGESEMTESIITIVVVGYQFLGLLVFIDFISLGGFKRIKDPTISRIYSWIYRFFSTITLSFLYRPLLYNFIDHKYTRRLFFLSIPYILVIVLSWALFTNNNYPHFPLYKTSVKVGSIINDFNYNDRMNTILTNETDAIKSKKKGKMADFILSKYYMDEPFPSLFCAIYPSDQDLLLHKKKMYPFFEGGFRWNLFIGGEYDDPDQEKYEDKLSGQILAVRKYSATLKDSLKILNDTCLRDEVVHKISLLKDSIAVLEKNKNKKVEEWNQVKMLSIKDTLQSLVKIYVDEINYSDSIVCHFYIHPNLGEKGLLCHFNSASITKGLHNLKIERIKYSENEDTDSLFTDTVILPFIKIN